MWDETVSVVQLTGGHGDYVQILAVFTDHAEAVRYAALFPRSWYLVQTGSDEGRWMPVRDDEHRRELQSRTVVPFLRTISVTACNRVPWNPPIALPPTMTPPPGVDGPAFDRRPARRVGQGCWHCSRLGHVVCHDEDQECPHDPGPAHP